MPLNFRVEGPWDERHHAQNARALRDVIDLNLNAFPVEVMDILPKGSATRTDDAAINSPVLDFVNGVDNAANCGLFSLSRPPHWADGLVTTWVMYTQATGDSSNVRFVLQTFAGDSVSTNTNVTTTQDFPGCSPAYGIKQGFFVQRLTVRPQALFLSFRLGRDGLADANSQTVRLLRVILKFQPTAREW